MSVEIEAKWVDVNFTDLRQKLLQLGAIKIQPERLMRRVAYDFPDKQLINTVNAWVRVRDEGNKVTLSYKQMTDRSLLGTKEVSIVVDNYDQANEFATKIGLIPKGHQETKRETWQLGDTEITLDTWPWLPPMIEIESVNEPAVWSLANKLGLAKNKATYGGAENVYTLYYDVAESEVLSWPEIKFEPVPAWLESKRRQ